MAAIWKSPPTHVTGLFHFLHGSSTQPDIVQQKNIAAAAAAAAALMPPCPLWLCWIIHQAAATAGEPMQRHSDTPPSLQKIPQLCERTWAADQTVCGLPLKRSFQGWAGPLSGGTAQHKRQGQAGNGRRFQSLLISARDKPIAKRSTQLWRSRFEMRWEVRFWRRREASV